MTRLISSTACLIALAVPAYAVDAFTCTARDAVTAESGSFVRNKMTEFMKNAVNPITVDTTLGMIQIGQSKMEKWTIVPGHGEFVARGSSLPIHSPTIRLRSPTDSQPTFVYTTWDFTIYTGTCEAIF